MERFVVGISGASGVILGKKTVEAIVQAGHFVELVITKHGLYTASLELGEAYASPSKWRESFGSNVRMHSNFDMAAPIASGSFQVSGMVIVPCSMASVAALSIGLGDTALKRAADVQLKEKRPLVIVPRETPFSTLHLENLTKLSSLGAMIVPPMPAWYTAPQSLQDVEDFIVGKTLDALKIEHALYPRWQGRESAPKVLADVS